MWRMGTREWFECVQALISYKRGLASSPSVTSRPYELPRHYNNVPNLRVRKWRELWPGYVPSSFAYWWGESSLAVNIPEPIPVDLVDLAQLRSAMGVDRFQWFARYCTYLDQNDDLKTQCRGIPKEFGEWWETAERVQDALVCSAVEELKALGLAAVVPMGCVVKSVLPYVQLPTRSNYEQVIGGDYNIRLPSDSARTLRARVHDLRALNAALRNPASRLTALMQWSAEAGDLWDSMYLYPGLFATVYPMCYPLYREKLYTALRALLPFPSNIQYGSMLTLTTQLPVFIDRGIRYDMDMSERVELTSLLSSSQLTWQQTNLMRLVDYRELFARLPIPTAQEVAEQLRYTSEHEYD